nr:MAG TPA: PcFK1 Cystine Knot, toxin [Caudoviricetes sp.]
MFSNKGKMISSPELITSLGFFLCPYCRLLQRRYGGCLPCDLALVEKSRF